MQHPKRFQVLAGVAALAMVFGTSNTFAQGGAAQTPTTGSTTSAQSKAMSKGDQEIMREMAYSNLAEIETGRLALSQSKNDQIKSFAQKMIGDHSQAQKDLELLAQSKGVTLPTEPDRKHKEAAQKLSALQGDKFDQKYLSQGGLSDHKDTHNKLEKAQKNASDPDLKSLIAKTIPVVEQHLATAQGMTGKKGGVSSSMSDTSGASVGTAAGAGNGATSGK
jgi:putative membrane protein